MARIACTKPIAAFLDLIAASEGTSSSTTTHDDGYDVIVTGINGPNTFSDYSAHPFAAGRAPIVLNRATPPLLSTASGRYQLILPTWEYIARARTLGTFSPPNQDLAALALIEECGAAALVGAGKVQQAIQAAAETWASFPGNSYGQGGRPMAWLLSQYALLLAAQP